MKKNLAEFIGTFWLVLWRLRKCTVSCRIFSNVADRIGRSLSCIRTNCTYNGLFNWSYFRGASQSGSHNWLVGWRTIRRKRSIALYYFSGSRRNFSCKQPFISLLPRNCSPIGSFAANGYGEHSPGQYSLLAAILTEFIMTFMFLIIILGATDEKAPKRFCRIGHWNWH